MADERAEPVDRQKLERALREVARWRAEHWLRIWYSVKHPSWDDLPK